MKISPRQQFEPLLTARAGLRTAMVVLSTVGILSLLVVLQIFNITGNMNALQAVMERSIGQQTQIRRVFSLLREADLSQTRYLATRSDVDLDNFTAARGDFMTEDRTLRTLLDGSPTQLERQKKLAGFARNFFAELEKANQPGASLDPARPPVWSMFLPDGTSIRQLEDQMVAYESAEITRAAADIQKVTSRSRTVSVVTLGVVALLVAMVLLYGLLYLSNRNRVELVLREANHLAEEASQAKTDFLATMSHEIRTPLTGVLGFTELLQKENLTTKQRELADRIETAGAHLSTIVNDILDFSKIEAGQVALHQKPFSLAGLIDTVISMASVLAEKKGLEIRHHVDPALPDTLFGDAARLQQILLNLLSNAVKFTREGHIDLIVHKEGTHQKGEQIRIVVKDTGVGFAREKRELLFTRFSQLDTSARREFGGTGLGLAISKQLVDMMGGDIGADSMPGRGATFWLTVTLPRAEAGALPAEPREPARVNAKGRILLVEDSQQNQELISTILRSAGHAVDIAGDGLEAVEAVQKSTYDLILMDVQLPRMAGPTATKAIRDLDHPSRNIPVVALTANVLPQQVSSFRKAGMNDFIAKPFGIEKLLAKVNGWLDSGEAREPAPSSPRPPNMLHDPRTLEDIQNLMGEAWIRRALMNLREETTRTFAEDSLTAINPNVFKKKVHLIVSHSAQLGFFDLSRACAEVEDVCLRGGNVRVELNTARRASERALSKIDEILAVSTHA